MKKNKIIAIITGCILTLSNISVLADDTGSMNNFVKGDALTFNDISSSDWYFDSVSKASAYHILEGDAGLFNPQGSLSIAQALTIAARMNSIYYNVTLPNGATENHWAENTLKYAEANNIVAKGTYSLSDLDRSATRAQMLEMFFNALPSSEYSNFLNSGTTAKTNNETVKIMYQAGIVTGDDNGNLNETSAITRAEAATIILRIIDSSERVVDNGVTSGYIYVSPELTQTQTQSSNYASKMSELLGFDVTTFIGNNTFTPTTVYVAPTTEAGQKMSLSPTSGYSQINCKYGTHTYSCNNQEEYDKLVSFVESEIDKYLASYTTDFLTSFAYTKIEKPFLEDDARFTTDSSSKPLVEAYGLETAKQIYQLICLDSYIVEGILNDLPANDTSPNLGESAYDLIFKGGADCDGFAHLACVIGDILGFDTRTAISKSENHAWCEAMVGGQWLDWGGTSNTGNDTYTQHSAKTSDIKIQVFATSECKPARYYF